MGENMTSLERDTLSRNRIVSETDENFFVEAGAGSGKTTMLVNRMVAMVEAGIDISRICAITFTRAAAGEFYDRFQKMLIKRSSPAYTGEDTGKPGSLPCPTDVTRARCSAALQNIDLCFMGTIDSFCGMVLSEHPGEAKIPSDAAIVSDEEASAMYRRQYVKILAGEHGEELQALAKTFQALHRGAQDVFVQGMSFIMNNRNVHFNFHEAAAVDIDRDFQKDKREILNVLEFLMKHPELKYTGNKPSREAWDRLREIYNSLRRSWSGNYYGVLFGLKDFKAIRVIPEALDRYAVSLGTLFVPGGKGKKPKWLEAASGEDGGVYEKLRKLQYDASMTFLVRSVYVMEQVLREKGNLTFFDYLYCLRNMLREDAEGDGKLIRYIYDRHSYFLIDEFQDTNPLQAEVFFYLTAENPVPQWSACVPRKGSLFIVGDPKQSIYRFRSADVTSFLKVKKLFEKNGGAVLSLSRNFRSTGMLCGYFNRVFADLLPEETENQSRFEEIPLPEPTENEFQGIYTYKAYTGGKGPASNPEMEDPIRIAYIIERLVSRKDCRLRAEGDAEPRPVRYSDFMVITYGKKKLGPIMAELNKRGIPTKVEGDVPFAENDALIESSRIFSAVADADDTMALYSALTGKILALTKEDILQYRACGGKVSLKAPSAAVQADAQEDKTANVLCAAGQSAGQSPGQEDAGSDASDIYYETEKNAEQRGDVAASAVALLVENRIKRLKTLYEEAMRLSPAALFSRILDEFRVYGKVPSDHMEVVYYALELLRNAEKSGQVISLKDGAAFLNNLKAGASGEERCLSLDAERDCVHMANLHKVKGLEAPIVILAASSGRSFSASCRMEHGDNRSEGYIFSLGSERNENGKSTTYFGTEDYAEEAAKEREALSAEGQRLVYVAATRARNALFLCDSVQIRGDREIRDSKWTPLMETGLPDFFESIKEASGGSSADTRDRKEEYSGDVVENRDPEHVSVDAAALYESAQAASVLNDRSAETATFHAENPSRLHVVSRFADHAEEDPAGTAFAEEVHAVTDPAKADPAKEDSVTAKSAERYLFPALLGTMTHKLMEMLVTAEGHLDLKAAAGEIFREYRTAEMEQYESRLTELLCTVGEKMRNGGYVQNNGLPQDMLGTLLSAEEVYCEVPFCYMDETEDGKIVWNGIMDVVYQAGGRWHIVDYKTNADGNDLDRRYQGQLSAYRKAFKATTGLNADAFAYHIDI